MSASSRKGLAEHLRYISRENATNEQDKGKLFGKSSDDMDRGSFIENASDDRHHFRFIISPEEGSDMKDRHGDGT
jgi:type IV secretory pathway VirD2 relaxase